MGSIDRWTLARGALGTLAAVVLGYLAVLAVWPQLRTGLPGWIGWFGRPHSALSIGIAVAVLAALAFALNHAGGGRRSAAPIAVVAGLASISAVLGLISYASCHDETHPPFFTPLVWTAALVKGGSPEQALGAGPCPAQVPVALEVAQLCALAAVFLSVLGVATALFQGRLDRLRVYFASAATVIVDIDDDAVPMVIAVARSQGRGATLAVLTDSPDRPCVAEARNAGARIVTVDFSRPESVTGLRAWRGLQRLYLLSSDPSANLSRLATITPAVRNAGAGQRIPLIVRIDDPWQAVSWRARQFGGTDTSWAADAVGRYEVTATRLLDRVLSDERVGRILMVGTSQLTLALCAEMSQRQLERDYHAAPGERSLPDLTLIGFDAEEYRTDHVFARGQLGLPADRPPITAIADTPTPALLAEALGTDPAGTAVIFVDADPLTGSGTRLAARFPDTAIYAWDPAARGAEDRIAVVGRLQTYRLSMDLPDGLAQDGWERAARLIHERYVAESGSTGPAGRPWDELDPFYRESNRRQVRNALRIVEQYGGHTWNTWGTPAGDWPDVSRLGRPPLEQLAQLGFDRNAALAMARAEHEDWCGYYRAHGWRHGPVRDNSAKLHDKLVDWDRIEADPRALNAALASLAATLTKLVELGYRSRSVQHADA